MEESLPRSRHPDSIGQILLWVLLPILLLVLNAPDTTYAQVVTNITPTTSAPLDLGTDVDTVGTTIQITGGTRPGSGTNLFHSFDVFTLGTGDTAHFLNDMQLPTDNIFARVIGGEVKEASTIDGTLRTNNPLDPDDPMNFGAANLWLVNPSGIFLGPNARIEVGGSVSMSTANYLRFFDGTTSTLFDMLSSPASLGQLSVAPVVAFGFVGLNPGDITVQGSQLSVTDGQGISLVGGKVVIESGTSNGGTAQTAQLSAPNGTIQLATAASPGEFDVSTLESLPNVDSASFTSFGSAFLALGSTINVSGARTVFLKGGQLMLSLNEATLNTSADPAPTDTISLGPSSSIVTSNSGSGPGADVQITVGNLNLGGSAITSENLGDGIGGSLSVATDTLMLSDGGMLSASTFGVFPEAAAGAIRVDATTVSLTGGSQIVSDSFGPGVGGVIHITASDLVTLTGTSADGLTPTLVGANFQATGNTGDIVVETKNFTASGGALIRTESAGSRTAGSIHVKATETVSLAGESEDGVFGSGLFANTVGSAPDAGDGGSITVEAKNLTLEGSAQIASGSFGFGDGGTINVTVAEVLTIAGTSRDVIFASGLFTNTDGSGKSGNIFVTTKYLSAEGGGQISTSSFGSGTSGDIRVTATELLTLKGRSPSSPTERDGSWPSGVVATAESGASDAGDAGNIVVEAKELIIEGGAGILSASFGPGAGGVLQVTATEAVTLTGVGVVGDTVFASGLSTASVSESPGTGDAGNLVLVTKNLALREGAQITSATEGSGVGGNLTVQASRMTMDSGAKVSAASSGSGDAGNIMLNTDQVTLGNGAQITTNSVGAATGRAGSITVQGFSGAGSSAQSVSLTGANTSITSDTDNTGRGGDIQIRAGQVQLADLASVTVETSGTGRAGSIGMMSDNLSVTGGARIEASTAGVGRAGDITITNTDTVSVTGLSSNGSTRSGIFAKTQTTGGTAGGGSGGGGGGAGGGGGGGGAGGGGGQTSTAGDAGNISVTTNNLLLSGGAQIDSSTTTSGSGGSLSVNADAITITGTSTSLKSDASRGNGIGGDIALAARTIGIHDKASVTAATDGSGNAGNISMTANERFTLDSAANITTSTRGSGRGGTILINSPQVLVDGLGTSITADTLRPFADFAVTLNILHPNDGDLTVRLDSPDGTRVALLSRVGGSGDNFTGTIFDDQATQQITSGSAPFTGTFKPREPLAQLIDQSVAGTWKLNVSDQVTGDTGSPQNLQSWSLRVGAEVFESTNVPRNIPDNGSISSNLVVAAGVVIQGVGEAPGVGGDVTINAGTVTVQNGAILSATTRGSGQGGTVNVNATGMVALVGPGTGLLTNSEASGGSGNINVAASRMTMDSGAKVSAASSGTGDAGNITINAGQEYLSTNSAVTTQAAHASGGDIAVNAQEMIRLMNSQINTSVAGGTTSLGGNITIDPQFVILQNSQILAQAFAGSGGNITIISNVFLADPSSSVDASSQLGISGQINIQSPVQNVGGQLTPLSQQFSSAAALLLAQRCAARAVDGKFSTFLVAAREGLPVEPGGFLASPSLTSELLGSRLSGQDSHTLFSAVTGSFPGHDANPIQLAKYGGACR